MALAFINQLGGWELILILIVVLLLFGSTRLPKLARSLGQASKEFKQGVVHGEDDDSEDDTKPDTKADDAKTKAESAGAASED